MGGTWVCHVAELSCGSRKELRTNRSLQSLNAEIGKTTVVLSINLDRLTWLLEERVGAGANQSITGPCEDS
jgi:hypothetical protein